MEVAGLLRRARVDAGLSQTDLAEQVGMTQSVISAYEHGHRVPNLESMVRLMLALSIDPRELVEL